MEYFMINLLSREGGDTSTSNGIFVIYTKQCYHSIFRSSQRSIRKTDRRTSVANSILKNNNSSENGLRVRRFPVNGRKVFKKIQTAALQTSPELPLNLTYA